MKLTNLIAFLFEDDPRFGKYLLGQVRKKPEKDTETEKDFQMDLYMHYHGSPSDLNPWISTLDKLERQGKYKDVLKVPSKYKYAYRVMGNVSLKDLTKILGYEPTGYEPDQIYEEDVAGGTFYPKDFRDHYSWTVDYNVFKEIQKDWGNLSFLHANKKLEFLVFLRAPIEGNRFLLNPEETKNVAKEYQYQKEVISIGQVKCDHVWYIPIARISDFQANVKNISDREKEAMSHIAAYEKDRNKRRR